MAERKISIMMEIGAALGSTFKSAVGGADARIRKLGSTVGGLQAQPTRKLMEGFHRLKDKVRSSRKELQAAENDLQQLKAQADAAGGAKGMLARRIEQAETRVRRMQASVSTASRQFVNHKLKIDETGRGLGELSSEYRRLTGEMQRAQRAQAALSKVQVRHQSVLQKRAAMRGQLLDMVALGATAAAPVTHAMHMEEAQVRLKTVLNADDKDKALAEGKKTARDLAKSGLVGLGESYDIQYALNSAGLDAAAARSASRVVAKVAKVTSGVPERVGEVVATTMNNLGSSLEGSTDERLQRIGDLLTKAQLKFQIRDFGQLGDSMTEGAAGLSAYNVELAQGVTLLGQLNTAGLQGGRAGTALNAVLRSLGKAQEEYGIDIVRNKKGQLDLIATMEQLKDATAGMDTDTRAQSLQKVFGDEGKTGVVPLLMQLDALKAAYADVQQNSKGIVDSSVQEFIQSSTGQWARLTGTVSVLGSVVGSTLLPGLNAVAGTFSSVLGPVAAFAAQHETITAVVTGAVVGLIGLKVAAIGLGYAWTFVQGGALMVHKGLLLIGTTSGWATMRTKVFGAAQRAWAATQSLLYGAAKLASVSIRAIGSASTWSALRTKALGAVQRAWAVAQAVVTGAAGLTMTAIRTIGSASTWTAVRATALGAVQRAWAATQALVTGAAGLTMAAIRAIGSASIWSTVRATAFGAAQRAWAATQAVVTGAAGLTMAAIRTIGSASTWTTVRATALGAVQRAWAATQALVTGAAGLTMAAIRAIGSASIWSTVRATAFGAAQRAWAATQAVVTGAAGLTMAAIRAIGSASIWSAMRATAFGAVQRTWAVTQAVVTGAAGLASGAIRAIGSAAIWTTARTTALGVAQKAWAVGQAVVTGACTAIGTAFRAMGLAVMANPIGLIVGGLAIGATLIMSNWGAVKSFFADVWSSVVEAFTWAWDKIKSIPLIGLLIKGTSAVGDLIGSIGNKLGSIFGEDKEQTADKPAHVGRPGSRQDVVAPTRQVVARTTVATTNNYTQSPAQAAKTATAGPPIIVRAPAAVSSGAPSAAPSVARMPGIGRATQERAGQASSPRPLPRLLEGGFMPKGTKPDREGSRVDRIMQGMPQGNQTLTIQQTVNVSGGADANAVKTAVKQANDGLEDRVRKIAADLFRERERTAYA